MALPQLDPGSLCDEARDQLWFTSGVLVPGCIRACDRAPLDAGSTLMQRACATRDADGLVEAVATVRRAVHHDVYGGGAGGRTAELRRLVQLCGDVAQACRTVYPFGATPGAAVDDAAARSALVGLHGGIREARPLWSGTEAGMVAELLVAGVGWHAAVVTTDVALGHTGSRWVAAGDGAQQPGAFRAAPGEVAWGPGLLHGRQPGAR